MNFTFIKLAITSRAICGESMAEEKGCTENEGVRIRFWRSGYKAQPYLRRVKAPGASQLIRLII